MRIFKTLTFIFVFLFIGFFSVNAVTVNRGSSSIWGQITGTLSNQTDLSSALSGKANTSHTQAASTISDFDTEVSNNTDVSSNTSHRTSSGADHTYIDQSVVSGSTPTFTNTNFSASTDKNYVTDAEKTVIGNTSGSNTGDQSSGDFDHNSLTNTHNLTTDIDHGNISGLTDDDHTQYALLDGRTGGQTLIGGTDASNNLTLKSTSNVTKGKIFFGANSAYDEVNGRLGIGTSSPTARTHIRGSTSDDTAYALKVDDSSDASLFNVRNDGLVNLGNGFTNQNLFKEDDYLMPTNPFGGKTVNYNQFHNALFLADRRWTVTANYYNKSDDSLVGSVSAANISKFFDGNYETYLEIPFGQYVLVEIDFGGIWSSYGYGYVYASHYHTGFAESEELQVYCNYAPHTIGWHYFEMEDYVNNGINNLIRRARNSKHEISLMNVKIVSPDSGITSKITQLDWGLERPVPSKEMPFVTKFTDETLYNDLDFKNNSGNVDVHLSNNGQSYFLNNVGIGTITPNAKLDVAGGIKIADDSDTCDDTKVGTLKYYSDANNSYVDMCMQDGASSYSWTNIKTNNW